MKKIDMKYGKYRGSLLILLVSCCLWTACHRDYLIYDEDNKNGIFFLSGVDSTYLGGSGLDEWCEGSVRLDILGFAEDRDRYVKVSVVDSLTTIPSSDFLIDSCYVPANEIYTLLKVRYSRSSEVGRKLCLALEENENFRPVMISRMKCTLSTGELTEPSWWTNAGGIFGEWSPRMLQLLLEFYKKVEQENPYVWDTYFVPYMGTEMDRIYMLTVYDPYKHVWNSPYKELITKYVIRPWYDYMEEHPEEGENTIPNPYN